MSNEVRRKKKISWLRYLLLLILLCIVGYFLYLYFYDGGITTTTKKEYNECKKVAWKCDKNVIGIVSVEGRMKEQPVYKGFNDQDLTFKGAGLDKNTGDIEKSEQTILLAHREYAFKTLGKVKVNDIVHLELYGKKYKFKVEDTRIVHPDYGVNVYKLNNKGTDLLTMITCYPVEFWTFPVDRLVVDAKLIK